MAIKNGMESWGFRYSDLPRPRWWGRWFRFFKTFDVLFFKLLQVLDIYRPQKSIVAVPGLAMPNFTMIQAVVYNGSQEEVLGFRPRRLLHRILRGLPDMELFERIQFQLRVSDHGVRSVQGSTESRGFVQLQLPWPMPWRSPKRSWIRMEPKGVETLVGRIRLGDYEMVSAPVFFLSDEIKFLVISDIDDTIKDTNIAESVNMGKIVRGLFRGHFYDYHAIAGMAEIYQELVKQGGLIVYLTSTPYALAPFLLKFLHENGFPEGPVFLRWLGYGRFGHKWRSIHRILSNLEKQKCYLVGDSGEMDLQIYRRICDTDRFGDRVEKVLIRQVPGTVEQRPLHKREVLYRTTDELREALIPSE